MNSLIPSLRAQLAQRVDDPRASFWDLASALELAAIARDWPEADKLVKRLVSGSGAQWSLATVVSQLQQYEQTLNEPDLGQLRKVVEPLEAMSSGISSNA